MNNALLFRDIHVPVSYRDEQAHDQLALEKAQKQYHRLFRDRFGAAQFKIFKRSIDARDKEAIRLIYTVAAYPEREPSRSLKLPASVTHLDRSEPDFSHIVPEKTKGVHPVVVGFGPAGMFCAYALARVGLAPLVIERGSRVNERVQKVQAYWQTGILDENTNVQFGEGGAGTFSDGKLLTRIHDPLCHYILQTLVTFGAPDEILYLAKPHIGTDKLRRVVQNIREEILRLGGSFLFDTTFTGYACHADGSVASIQTTEGEYPCSALFLCIGHSARDTFGVLQNAGLTLSPKPFSVGVRVEHLQADIDRALYGSFAGSELLGPASYTLSAKVDGRAVYSFCMCPGGVVVASASEKGEIVTNGMSYYARDGKNANSAIAVSIAPSDYGSTVEGAIAFQKKLETAAFSLAGGNGAAPIQRLDDFLCGAGAHEPTRIQPTYTGGTSLCSLSSLFPDAVTHTLQSGFRLFEKHIEGFCAPDAILTAPETRTSSPVRIDRTSFGESVSVPGIYPCGEGAGYAGGITSAAVDGLKSALAFAQRLRDSE